MEIKHKPKVIMIGFTKRAMSNIVMQMIHRIEIVGSGAGKVDGAIFDVPPGHETAKDFLDGTPFKGSPIYDTSNPAMLEEAVQKIIANSAPSETKIIKGEF